MSLELDKNYLKNKQYKSTNYLDSRIAVHQYNINSESFFEWSWRKMNASDGSKIVEIGCGPGTFWNDNKKHLSEDSSVLMTDFSNDMLDKAKNNINDSRFAYEITDIDNINYPDESYDVIMAHFVLYHSSDKSKSLSDLSRICKKDGFVSITTNSEKHMFNVYEIGKSIDDNFPTDRNIDSFTEEMADDILPKHFSKIEKFVNKDYLRITDKQLVLDYVRSAVEPREIAVGASFYDDYSKIVEDSINKHGYFEIPKRSPLYKCTP